MKNDVTILVVDDDPALGELLKEYLGRFDFRVVVAQNGREMRQLLKSHAIDLVVLDVMLPGDDGVTLCRELRETSEVPVLMLSAAGSETDRVVGLEVGADDYLAKPFSPRELLARIKALLRRSVGELGQKRSEKKLSHLPKIHFLDWTLDQRKQLLISPQSVAIPLSKGEYDLLLVFLENPQRILSRDQLLDLTRGRTAGPFERTIDVQVGRLRKKIERDPKNPKVIVTVRGGGYQFMEKVTLE